MCIHEKKSTNWFTLPNVPLLRPLCNHLITMKEVIKFITSYAAFQHGIGSEKPLKYTHLDVAASAGDLPKHPTGAPILALAKQYLFGALEDDSSNSIDAKSPEK